MKWNDYSKIPPLVLAALIRFRDTGCPTGSFTEACISGDLFDACRRGDDDSLKALVTIVVWVQNEMPRKACGSRENYRGWSKLFDDLRCEGKTNVRYNHGTGRITFSEIEPVENEVAIT